MIYDLIRQTVAALRIENVVTGRRRFIVYEQTVLCTTKDQNIQYSAFHFHRSSTPQPKSELLLLPRYFQNCCWERPLLKTMRLGICLLPCLLTTYSVRGFVPKQKVFHKAMTQLSISTSTETMTKDSLFGTLSIFLVVCRVSCRRYKI